MLQQFHQLRCQFPITVLFRNFFAAVRVICDHCIGTRRTDEPHIFFLIYSPYMDFLFLPPALFHKSFILNVVKCRVQCIRSHHIRSITDRIDDSIAVSHSCLCFRIDLFDLLYGIVVKGGKNHTFHESHPLCEI